MDITKLAIPELVLIQPQVFEDARGFFLESFNQAKLENALGRKLNFVQDNHSKSSQYILRGLHQQVKNAQGKLVRVIAGEIFDVAIDMRPESATYGRSVGVYLSADNKQQLWIPEGFAHGFFVLSESAEVLYKATDYYAPQYERSILWNDSTLNINWPIPSSVTPIISEKDSKGLTWDQVVSVDAVI
jgi:dTDP-4-dehydrorhamnose 3,5-epimerase